MTHYIYKTYKKSEILSSTLKINNEYYTIKVHKIGENGHLYFNGESKSLKTTFSRILFSILTFNRAQIFMCINSNNKIVHTSYVIPYCKKFPFMSKNDYEIGPCMTVPEYRGKGIYPQILNYIIFSCGTENSNFFMLVSPSNHSSIRGIEKAGFTYDGTAQKTKFKTYRRSNHE